MVMLLRRRVPLYAIPLAFAHLAAGVAAASPWYGRPSAPGDGNGRNNNTGNTCGGVLLNPNMAGDPHTGFAASWTPKPYADSNAVFTLDNTVPGPPGSGNDNSSVRVTGGNGTITTTLTVPATLAGAIFRLSFFYRTEIPGPNWDLYVEGCLYQDHVDTPNALDCVSSVVSALANGRWQELHMGDFRVPKPDANASTVDLLLSIGLITQPSAALGSVWFDAVRCAIPSAATVTPTGNASVVSFAAAAPEASRVVLWREHASHKVFPHSAPPPSIGPGAAPTGTVHLRGVRNEHVAVQLVLSSPPSSSSAREVTIAWTPTLTPSGGDRSSFAATNLSLHRVGAVNVSNVALLTQPYARRDSAEYFSRLNALLFTAMGWIFIPAHCFAVP